MFHKETLFHKKTMFPCETVFPLVFCNQLPSVDIGQWCVGAAVSFSSSVESKLILKIAVPTHEGLVHAVVCVTTNTPDQKQQASLCLSSWGDSCSDLCRCWMNIII